MIGTPPPKGDLERLCANFAHEPHFIYWASNIGLALEPASLSRVPFMVKLWRLLQDMLEELAREHSAALVPVPAALLQGDGILPDAHWSSDATHAGESYGRAMLDELVRHVEADPATARSTAA